MVQIQKGKGTQNVDDAEVNFISGVEDGSINLDLLSESNLDEFLIDLLIRQITYGLPGTSGDFCSNTLAYILTEHDLLSIFFTHPLDPFSRNKRAVYFYITLVIVLACTVYFTDNHYYIYSYDKPFSDIYIGLQTAIILEPLKVILRRAIECPCVRRHTCIYRICLQNNERQEVFLRIANAFSWILLVVIALGSTGATIYILLFVCYTCLDPMAWLVSQAFSLLFVSICVILLYVRWNFVRNREIFKDKVADIFGISRDYQESHNIVSVSALAQIILNIKGVDRNNIQKFKIKYKLARNDELRAEVNEVEEKQEVLQSEMETWRTRAINAEAELAEVKEKINGTEGGVL